MKVKGLIEIFSNGKLISKTNNNFLLDGEDMLAAFLAKSFSNKYDANEGASQDGYFDFIAVGTGFKAPVDGALSVIVLPNKPIGVADEQVDIYDGATVKIHSGANAGVDAVVAENGYNPSNAEYENNPTITLTENLDSIVSAGDQFSISSRVSERALQGEGRPDHNDVTFLNTAFWRWPIIVKKKLSAITSPAGSENTVFLQATIGPAQLSGGANLLLTEVGIVNTATPATPTTKSGSMLSRGLITPTYVASGETLVINWYLRLGSDRELSI